MKNIFFFLLLIFSTSFFGQESQQTKKPIKISYKNCLAKKGYSFRLKEITSDSRCPEGVQCIWAGEVHLIVLVYKDKKMVEETKLTLSPNNNEEAINFFTKYDTKNKIKSIYVFPFPIKDKILDKKQCYLEVDFE